jgi:hypothetical protein
VSYHQVVEVSTAAGPGCAYAQAWLDCEFIYTYDRSTWERAVASGLDA